MLGSLFPCPLDRKQTFLGPLHALRISGLPHSVIIVGYEAIQNTSELTTVLFLGS